MVRTGWLSWVCMLIQLDVFIVFLLQAGDGRWLVSLTSWLRLLVVGCRHQHTAELWGSVRTSRRCGRRPNTERQRQGECTELYLSCAQWDIVSCSSRALLIVAFMFQLGWHALWFGWLPFKTRYSMIADFLPAMCAVQKTWKHEILQHSADWTIQPKYNCWKFGISGQHHVNYGVTVF